MSLDAAGSLTVLGSWGDAAITPVRILLVFRRGIETQAIHERRMVTCLRYASYARTEFFWLEDESGVVYET